jgi:membrane-anchored protein YejM (alkaline phosphatase superfamily)
MKKTNNQALASENYKKSIKGNANFEMVFYAKLKLIQMNRGNNSEEKETEKLLAKMTKDNKNKPYFDQLFYEKALIALENDEIELAKKHFVKIY